MKKEFEKILHNTFVIQEDSLWIFEATLKTISR